MNKNQLSKVITYMEHPVGEGNGNLLQFSHLEHPMDRGAWRAAVHGVAESWTGFSD